MALGAALSEQVRRLLLHDPGVRIGTDPEELHQLRVATRRLRAFLRAGRPLLDSGWSEPLRDEIGWLGRALGPARDLDVLIGGLTADAAKLDGEHDVARGLLNALAKERENARGLVVDALSSDRYLLLLERLEAAGAPELSGRETTLREVWRAEWRRTRKTFARLDRSSPDPALHAARIRAKRARYAAELAAHELGKHASGFVRAAKDLQDVLGEHQDAVVAEARIEAWLSERGDDAGAAGLLEREQQRKRDTSAAWPAAWKALRRAAKPSHDRRPGGRGRPCPGRRDGDRGARRPPLGLRRLDVPKGKCEPGETDEACAVREVAEETGLVCALEEELPSTSYTDSRGRPKRVRYWRLRVVGGTLAFDHEVDGGRWLSPGDAEALLTYARDLDVLRAVRASSG